MSALRHRTRALRGAVLCAATALLLMPSAALAVCDEPASPAGEWPTYGGDLSNSRHQPKGSSIGRDDALNITATDKYDAKGLIQTTPIVSGGCVFVVSQLGATVARIAALDADDLTEIWDEEVPVGGSAYGGPVVGAPALWNDLVITPINKRGGPFLIAHDRATGAFVWKSAPLDTQSQSGFNASAVAFNGLIFQGFFGNAQAGSEERGGFAIVDAATGAIKKQTYVIDDASFANDFDGAGIWSTAAVDPVAGYAYAGTSNPHNPHNEHERANSILKIDVKEGRPTFGEIVGSYKGVHDTVVPGAQKQPACETKDDVYYYSRFSTTCLAVDVDFGASPNLFTTEAGKRAVGELQKSGIYHIVDAGDMSGISRTPTGAPCFACNAGSSAFADGHAYVHAGPPGQMVAVNASLGVPVWAAPIGGGFSYNAVSVSNGVVWSVDSNGFLNGFDQQLGAPLVKRNIQDDAGVSMRELLTSSGIAIARNTLYTAAKTHVIAYRPQP